MFTTKALLKPFNSILAKLHHPPPLDKRESRRLLNALTESFRAHLDREHGFLSHDHPPPPSLYTLQSSLSASSATHDSDRRPTDRHVRAILSNPLFSYEPSTDVSPGLSAERDPMDVFDQAVAKGWMTPQRAAGALIAKRQAIAQSSSVSITKGMAASGTSHRVVSWLRSSGLEHDLSFASHGPLLRNLTPFMIEEGLEAVLWHWLDQWLRKVGPESSSAPAAIRASPFLTALVHAHVSRGSSLDAGYATMIQANKDFSHLNRFTHAALGPWTSLSTLSTVFAWQRTPPSAALFDSFAAMSDTLRSLRFSVQFDRAHLDLHHPTHPDATAALQCLKSPVLDQLRRRIYGPEPITPSPKTEQVLRHDRNARKVAAKVVLMATDAVQHLTRAGKDIDAEWVGNLLLEKFGDLLRGELVRALPDLHLLEPVTVQG